MLMKVVVENGQKKYIPLTADAGAGNPCGTIIAIYSNQVPYGYLPCNGVRFDTAQFPVLYAILGDDHTPDLRECALVGAGTSDRTMGAHDEYTVGQFKDDQLQKPTLRYKTSAGGNGNAVAGVSSSGDFYYTDSTVFIDARYGTTTHGKQVGVNFCIKATSGINENQADNVLSALTPVDQVALNNLHSVTSGAVYSKINELLYQNFYDANTDRTNIENRKQAILHIIKNFPSSMFTIRYLDGYYIFYIANPFFTSERTILEIDNYNGEINIYQINSLDTTISLVRSI